MAEVSGQITLFAFYCTHFTFTLLFLASAFSFCVLLVALLLLLNALVWLLRCFASFFNVRFERVELVNQYECGFVPFTDARVQFNVPFYIVSLLFVLFDVEVALLLPLPFVLTHLTLVQVYAVLAFFALLTFGFALEWFSRLLVLEVRHFGSVSVRESQ
jgi:NADH-quinone oxidoreductase subunit A